MRNMNQKNKKTEKRWIPVAMSTSLLASAFFSAGAPVLADELEQGDVTHTEKESEAKNHGKVVSKLAKSLNTPPGKGSIVSEVAKNKEERLEDPTDGADMDPDLEDPTADADEDVDLEDPTADADADLDLEDPTADADEDVDLEDPTADADADLDLEDPTADVDADHDLEELNADADVDLDLEDPTADADADTHSWIDEYYKQVIQDQKNLNNFFEDYIQQQRVNGEESTDIAVDGPNEIVESKDEIASEEVAEPADIDEMTEKLEESKGNEDRSRSVYDRLTGYYQHVITTCQSFVSIFK
ncbi:hypothetical protein BEP19_00530 [Ammoniphilus oxalaticus]|uniref:DUF5667 domain-containing protein n=1 Tax=Ammoniphilus oxalaticus TaxID=66863 RepID=A0A419SRE7_9BACL|nr:hypothetical protein [Ammoniphilus oxalaticus]RKD27092.1 hypothetical protein BEP19_00530 [Ammoniphilus oxalaticus]